MKKIISYIVNILLIISILILIIQLYPGGFYISIGSKEIHVHDLRATFTITLLLILFHIIIEKNKKSRYLEIINNSKLLRTINEILNTKDYMIALILFAGVFLSYSGVLNNSFLEGDDFIWLNIAHNIRSFKDILVIFSYFRPVITFFNYIIYLFSYLNPFGWYLSNILLHFLNSLLVFYVANSIIKEKKWSFFIALVFAVNYSHNEAILVLYGNTVLIVTLFSLCCLKSYFKFLETDNKYIYTLTLFLYVFALFAQESAIVLPIIMSIAYWFLNSGYNNRKLNKYLKHILPFIVISGIYLYIQYMLFSKNLLSGWNFGSHSAKIVGLQSNFIERLAYTSKVFYYSFLSLFKESLALFLPQLIFFVIIALFVFKKHIDNKNYKLMVFSLLCIVILYSPYSFAKSDFGDSKYLYFASIGSSFFIGGLLREIFSQLSIIKNKPVLYARVNIALIYFILFIVSINISSVNYQEKYYYEPYSNSIKQNMLNNKDITEGNIPYADKYKNHIREFPIEIFIKDKKQ